MKIGAGGKWESFYKGFLVKKLHLDIRLRHFKNFETHGSFEMINCPGERKEED